MSLITNRLPVGKSAIPPLKTRFLLRYTAYRPFYSCRMRQNTRNLRPPAVLLITPKFRDRLTKFANDADSTLTDRLSQAPKIKNKYVMVDLADTVLRDSLSKAVKPLASLATGIPPALVGSARRIESLIGLYEKQISNYDLFEDCP